MNKNWTKEGYKLYAMKDGFIMDFTMGSSETIENEIIAKGSRNYDFWLVEKDGKIDFYSVKIDPMAQGLGIEITKEKTISGTIVEDKRSNYQGFGAFGGGIPVDFMNYKIIEKTSEIERRKLETDALSCLKHCAGELAEAVESYTRFVYSPIEEKDSFPDELADVIMCILTLSAKENIDIEQAILNCLEKNRKRAREVFENGKRKHI